MSNIEKYTIKQIKQYSLLVFNPGGLPDYFRENLGRARTQSFSSAFGIKSDILDLDDFDDSYYHIILWDSVQNRIMGSYRLGLLDELIEKRGVSGIYSSTLYNFSSKVTNLLENTIELGRSFVHPDYQKVSSSLAILWSGLSWITSIKPKYTNFIGMVSVSQNYNEVSKWLMVDYMKRKREVSELSEMISPLFPYPFLDQTRQEALELIQSYGELETLQDLENLISKSDQKNLPPILKYYLRYTPIGLITYGNDPDFGNVMDLFSYAPIAHSISNMEKITQRFTLSRVA